MFDGLHHFHIRKRIHQKHEKFPHPNKWKRLMDKLIYVVGIVGPTMAIPQLLEIWIKKNAASVSLLSWVGFLCVSIFWLTYGLMHKEKPIILSSSLWIFFYSLIVSGIIIYG